MFTLFHQIAIWAVVLLLFNLTIFVHEMGHFLVGRWRKAKIEKFAIWFGPAIWSRKINGVEWRLGCIPLGGFVLFPQLAMEEIEGKVEAPKEEIPPLKPRDKIPILVAGSVFNLIFGVLVACVVWVVGIPRSASDFDMKVGTVAMESAEWAAGIRPGDEILTIDGAKVKDWDQVRYRVVFSLREKIAVGFRRGNEVRVVDVLPERDHTLKYRTLRLYSKYSPVVGGVSANSPAQRAGLQTGDEVVEMDGKPVLSWDQLVQWVESHGDQVIHMTVLRDGNRVSLEVTPRNRKETGKPAIGIGRSLQAREPMITVYPTPWEQVWDSLWQMASTFNALMHPKATGVGVGDLSGPVGIVGGLYLQAMLDIRLALKFLVLLNINLAILNLLPIPVLDGGHIVFTLIEAIRKRPLSMKIMEAVQMTFVVILLTFVVYVSYNDVIRMFMFRGAFSGKSTESQKMEMPVFEEMTPPR